MYNKIRQQISKQTRSTPKLAEINRMGGFVNYEQHKRTGGADITGQTPNVGNKISWDKYNYTFHRQNGPVGYPYYVLSMDINSPNYFWDFMGTSGIQHYVVDSNESGILLDGGWPSFSNVCYVININPNQPGVRFDFNLELASHCSLAIWAKNWNIIDSGNIQLSETPSLVYQTNGETSFDGIWNIPSRLSEYGAIIYILIYRQESGGYAKIATNMNARTWTGIILDKPQWYSTPITTSINQVTKNIENNLYINLPKSEAWRGISIYRATAESVNANVTSVIDTYHANNAFIVDNISRGLFPTGTKIRSDKDYCIAGSFILPGNMIDNGDFSWYSGSNLSDWTVLSSAGGDYINSTRYKCSAYPYAGDSLFNGQSLKMTCAESSTPKSFYIESKKYSLSTSSAYAFSFYTKKISGATSGLYEVIFYDTSDNVLQTFKGNYPESTVYPTWQKETMIFFWDTAISYGPYLPDTACSFKVRFYLSSSSEATYYNKRATTRFIDGVSFGKYREYDWFHTSASRELVVLTTSSSMKKITPYTTFDAQFYGSSKSYGDIYSDEMIGTPTPTNYKLNKYSSGYSICDYGKNYLQWGDFSSPHIGWIDNGLVYGSTWSCLETSDAIYNKYVYLIDCLDISTSQYIKQSSFSKAGDAIFTTGGDTAWGLSFFARGESGNEVINTILSDGITSFAESFNLTDKWRRYYRNIRFTNDAQTSCDVYLGFDSSYYGRCYIDGVQLESTSNYTPFVQFEYYPSALPRSRQSIRYYDVEDDIISSVVGTVRLWYSPLQDSHEKETSNRVIWYASASGIGQLQFQYLAYLQSTTSFAYRRCKQGVRDKTVRHYTAYSALEPFHLCAAWNEVEMSLYINGELKGTATGVSCRADRLHIGSNHLVGDVCNGSISQIRIEKSTWTPEDVYKDYLATKSYMSTTESFTKDTYINIGDKYKQNSDIEGPIEIVDKAGLDENTRYKYCLTLFDVNHNESEMSEPKYIVTGNVNRNNNKNYILNCNFEHTAYGKVLYFSSANPNTIGGHVSSVKKFKGNNSIYCVGPRSVITDYIMLDDTSSSSEYCFSYYCATANVDNGYGNYAKYYLYNKDYSELKNGTLSLSNLGEETGVDGNSWIRFSATISSLLGSSEWAKTKYIKLFNFTPVKKYFTDCWQLEKGNSASDFVENEFFTNLNVPPGTIDGSAITYNTLLCNRFYAGEIRIDSNTSSGKKLVIGRETVDSSFAVLTPNYFRYHQAGLPINSGWNFTKHVESGESQFNRYNSFDYPYKDWDGNSLPPLVVILPTQLKTYNSVYSADSQSLMIVSSVDPEGFNVKAQIVKSGTLSYDYLYIDKIFTDQWNEYDWQNVANFFRWHSTNPLPYYSASNLYIALIDPSQDTAWGCYIMPNSSKTDWGMWQFSLTSNFLDDILVELYATSQASTGFPYKGQWNLVKSVSIPLTDYYYNFIGDFTDSDWNNARSIGVKLYNDNPEGGCTLKSLSMYYSSNDPSPLQVEDYDSLLMDYNSISRQKGATVLPWKSLSNSGTLKVSVTNSTSFGRYVSLSLYCTSEASTSFVRDPADRGQWNSLGSYNMNAIIGTYTCNLNINHLFFNNAKSLGFYMEFASSNKQSRNYSISIDSLYYSTSAPLDIIDYGATVGAYRWISIDGGVYGG